MLVYINSRQADVGRERGLRRGLPVWHIFQTKVLNAANSRPMYSTQRILIHMPMMALLMTGENT
jgi:hypothetical protein